MYFGKASGENTAPIKMTAVKKGKILILEDDKIYQMILELGWGHVINN